MGIIGSLRETLEALEPDRRAGKTETAGSYWCDGCDVRRPAEDVPAAGDDAPPCPDCDEPMRFERAPDSASCAC